MRVRLSYTVDEEDVLAETAKIINLSASDIQQAIALFNKVQTILTGEEDAVVNVDKALEMIDEMRTAFLNVDTRLSEVTEIVRGFDDYQREIKKVEPVPEPPADISEGIRVTKETTPSK